MNSRQRNQLLIHFNQLLNMSLLSSRFKTNMQNILLDTYMVIETGK